MTNYREILRLHSLGLNKTEIASSCQCARNTVAATLQRAVAPVLDVNVGFLVQFADGGGRDLAAPQRLGDVLHAAYGKGRHLKENCCSPRWRSFIYEAYSILPGHLREAAFQPMLHPFCSAQAHFTGPTAEYSARDCAPQPLKLSIHSGGIEHPCRRR